MSGALSFVVLNKGLHLLQEAAVGEGLLQRAERRSSWRRWHLNWAWKDKESFTRQKWEGRESLAEETAWTEVGGEKGSA